MRKMKKTFALIVFAFLKSALFAQNIDSLLSEAKNAFSSYDFQNAQAKYAELDTIECFKLNYFDLFRYWQASEINRDEKNSESLLFRIVLSNAFEPKDIVNPNGSYVEFFGIDKRKYWPQIDSIVNEIKASRCYAYADSLKVMAETDQAIRNNDSIEDRSLLMCRIDSLNTAKLMNLMAQYGFPTWKLVGREGAENAWLIAQHSGAEFLPVFLKQMEKAVKEDNASYANYAMMEDRYRLFEGLPQYYGTQIHSIRGEKETCFAMIADIDNVNSRRRAAGYSSIESYAQQQGMDSVIIHSHFTNYSDYYLHLSKAKRFSCMGDSAYMAMSYELGWNRYYYSFPMDVELSCLCELLLGDTVRAVYLAKKMVLCGRCLEEEWHLPQFLIDSVAANYEDLYKEYKRQLSKSACLTLDTISSFESLVKVTEIRDCPRYCTEAWNTTVKKMIVEHACSLNSESYKTFFEWLYAQVVKGNFYLYDYAELYDEVYYRLYGKSYYGEKLFTDGLHVQPSEVEEISERRRVINLPPLWVSCNLKGEDCPQGYQKETYQEFYHE